MAKDSKIGWTHDTVNLWWGCTEAGPECDNCYARTLDKMRGPFMDKKNKTTHWGNNSPRWIRTEKAIAELKRLQRLAAKTGENRRVFINSMSDFFEAREDLTLPRAALFDLIPELPNLRILLLTKRPANIHKFTPVAWNAEHGGAPSNVAFGATVGTVKTILRFERLLQEAEKLSATTIFVSVEPMLDDISSHFLATVLKAPVGLLKNLWVLVGGESGGDSRPFDVSGALKLREVSEYGRFHFFMKQMGSLYLENGELSKFTPRDARSKMSDFPEALRVQQIPRSLI